MIKDPIKKLTLRIMAIVILAPRIFNKKLYLKRIRNNEMEEEKLKELDFGPPVFSIFNVKCNILPPIEREVQLHCYFSYSADAKPPKRQITIDNIHYSAALDYIYKKASEELERFNDRGFLKKRFSSVREG